MAAGFAAGPAFPVCRCLALVGKAFGQCPFDVVGVPVITVVAGLFASQKDVPGVMVVVVPLRSVMAGGRILFRREKSRAVIIVFKDKMDVAATPPSPVLRSQY